MVRGIPQAVGCQLGGAKLNADLCRLVGHINYPQLTSYYWKKYCASRNQFSALLIVQFVCTHMLITDALLNSVPVFLF